MRIGIIGTGWGARVQVPAFRLAGLEITGIAGRDAAKTAREAERLQTQPFSDWQALIGSDAELISIVTPPALHREIALAALAAGKHVLCEKPTALNTAEALAMAAAAQDHGDQLSLIDHELRFTPALRLAREIIQRGDLGTLRHVTSTVTGSGRADPNRAWNWWSDAAQGGGVWGAIGSHQIDTLRYLWGEISAISATLHTFIAQRPAEDGPRPVSADDYAAAQLRFASGGLGTVAISVVAAANQPNQLILHGEDGALHFNGERLLVAQRNGDWEERTLPARAFPSEIQGDFPEATVYLGEALRAWQNGDHDALAPAATFADGLRNQIVLDAGYQSQAEQGRWVPVPG